MPETDLWIRFNVFYKDAKPTSKLPFQRDLSFNQ